jgi:hypothetical protein
MLEREEEDVKGLEEFAWRKKKKKKKEYQFKLYDGQEER